ncbi:MAG: CP12 domain-containing protein [Vulcanococcus sp.]
MGCRHADLAASASNEHQSSPERHPEDVETPSPFEVVCDLNPANIQCRVYDD